MAVKGVKHKHGESIKKARTGRQLRKTIVLREVLEANGIDIFMDLIRNIQLVTNPKEQAELQLKLLPYLIPRLNPRDYQEPQVLDTTAKTLLDTPTDDLIRQLEVVK